MLSWAVRALNCKAGIVCTASHNPSKYNGYKAYGADGCQMTIEAADIVLSKINAVPMFGGAKLVDFDEGIKSGMIEFISQDVIEAYLDEVQKQQIHPEVCASSGLKVVYTPLNGTGNKPVRAILKRIGVSEVTVVPEQENPDGHFPTCPFPNPEIKEALHLGLELCKTVKPDLLLATDPDCDRVGIAVPDKDGNYVLFSGNEVGAMLLEYICKERIALGKMPKNPVAVKSIVSTAIADEIAKDYGVEMRNVLTGFKFIGEQIGYLEASGEAYRFIFGFEESYGYLGGSYVRDKDAVIGSMLICEMAAYYRSIGVSLLEAREAMYKKYGNYVHTVASFTCEGAAGMEEMARIMNGLHASYPETICGFKVVKVDDYEKSETLDIATGAKTAITLPKSDVLCYTLENKATVIIRPSGTEPKIKAYYTTVCASREEAVELGEKIAAYVKNMLGF
jgi:phosphoglucomutase